jgi:hypothetical protein
MDVTRLKQYFVGLLEWIGAVAQKERIVLLLDGIDQMGGELFVNELALEGLPPNLRVVVSVANSAEGVLRSIRKLVRAKANYLELKEMNASVSLGILDEMLKVINWDRSKLGISEFYEYLNF